MNNDVISRAALKKQIDDKMDERFRWDSKLTVCEFKTIVGDIIDNTPAVEMPVLELYKPISEKDRRRIIENLIKPQRLYISNGRPQGEWIPVGERLPEEKINPRTNDFEEVLCTTIWGDVRSYKFGTPIGHDEPHFWYGWGIMDKEIVAWQYKPEPYQKGGAE